MSLIEKTQVIKNCANAYRQASETRESIKVGELAEKIQKLSKTKSDGSFARPIIEETKILNAGVLFNVDE